MLGNLFRRRPLLRDWHCTPTPRPGCLSGIAGAAYPLRYASPRLVAEELRVQLRDAFRLPSLDELVKAFQQAARRARKKSEHFIYSMGDAYETSLLTLEFNNTNIANVGDATGLRGSTTAGSFFVALHTADPGEAGSQVTSEATFTSYARQGVARSSAGWTIAGNQVSNAALITFPQNTGSDQDVTHFSIGVATSGASVSVRYGPLIASGATWLPFTATAADTITIPGHTFSVNDRFVAAAAYDGTLPTGLSQGTIYWVKTVSGNDITISTTQGGATLDLTAAGTGVCIKAKPLTVRGGIDAVQFAIGTLVCKID
jgi:hypothetical protein